MSQVWSVWMNEQREKNDTLRTTVQWGWVENVGEVRSGPPGKERFLLTTTFFIVLPKARAGTSSLSSLQDRLISSVLSKEKKYHSRW